jgi:hypothetical protein
MRCRIRRSLLCVAVSLGLLPAPGLAQEKDQLRSQSKVAAAELRAVGEPKDRCALGAFVAGPGIVSRVYAETPLAPGDKILSLDGKDVAGKEANDIIALLRSLAPTATVPVKVERASKEQAWQLTCSNSRASMEILLAALDHAAAGKFDECFSAIADRRDLGTYGAVLKAQCAAVSKSAKKVAVPQYSFDAMKMVIEDAHWIPSTRPEVVQRLRAAEGMITQQTGKARYDELVALTRNWPGGESEFAVSEPDWRLFRRNAEKSLTGRLIDPDSARIEWPFGFTYGTWKPVLAKRVEGYWTCGLINARNRMGGYTGATSFVVVLDRGGNVLFADMGSGKDFDIVASQCGNSAKFLPSPPAAFAVAAAGEQAAAVSIADELKKLVELKNSGALTEAEFQAAKESILGDKGQ